MFSVIIPMYNSATTIERSLESLERQTRRELIEEVIVVNDGSTDFSERKVELYKENHTLPIKLISTDNLGPSAARNIGLNRAISKYVAFLDSDDEWELNKLERQSKILLQNPKIDLLCGGYTNKPLKIFMKKYTSLHQVTLREYCLKSIIYTSTVVIKRETAKKAGFFDEKMRYCEDMNYYQRFFSWNQVFYLPEKMILYGIDKKYYGEKGLSSNLKEMHRARRHNYHILWREKQISICFYIFLILFGEVKYIRRSVLTRLGI